MFFNNENTRTDVIKFNLICGLSISFSNISFASEVFLRRGREGLKGAYCKKRVEVRKTLEQPA